MSNQDGILIRKITTVETEESRIIIGFEVLLGQNNKQNIFSPTLREL
jgi:hypothetical protein